MPIGQRYGVSGRRFRPDYVAEIEAKRRYLPRKMELKNLEEYRKDTLSLGAENLQLAKDRLKAEEKADTMSSAIGLGRVAMESHYGLKRDTQLKEIISGGGGKAAEGAIEPAVSGGAIRDIGDERFSVPGAADTASDITKTSGIMAGLRGGAKNWGGIASGALTGGLVGSELTAKFIDDSRLARGLGGAGVSAGLTYLSTGDPYSSAISAVFGGLLGSFWS